MDMQTEAMPPKTEFKFNCPTCGQHILVATQWSGLGISCPSCQSRITIPTPLSDEQSPQPAISPKHTGQTIRIELPLKANQRTSGRNGEVTESETTCVVTPAAAQIEGAQKINGCEPWPDVVRKLENGTQVTPAELATALFEELTNVRRRLDALEHELARGPQIRLAVKRRETGEDSSPRPQSPEVAQQDPKIRSPANRGPVGAEEELEATSL